MPKVTVRQRNQVTIPVDIARAAGLREGTVCTMELVNGSIVVTPEGSAGPAVDSFAGAARGAWGSTPREVERTMESDRGSWGR